ncbi:MAG: lipoyl synthase [Bacillota bacterium]|nr:MAG: lipoyl synthase [Bacillota bacterium]
MVAGRPLILGHSHLGLVSYEDYLRLADSLRRGRLEGRLPDLLLTLEHPPVVTLGSDTSDAVRELRGDPTRLPPPGVPLYRVDRGGRATYHGPGQLMVYPVVDLRAAGLDPVDLADRLVEAVRAALGDPPPGFRWTADRGLWLERDPAAGRPGWSPPGDARRKLASVGLAVRGGVTSHGLACNLYPEPGAGFGLVNPCGDPGTKVTDLETATGRRVDRRGLAGRVAFALAGLLGRTCVPVAPEDVLGVRPPWLVTRAAAGAGPDGGLPLTVCDAADCPNRGPCRARGRATYLLLGPSCTRACAFCRVPGGSRPLAPDPGEPGRVAAAVAAAVTAAAGERPHIVLTSVTRDDLPDGGARHFAATVAAIRRRVPRVEIEVLLPDFRGKPEALDVVIGARPDIIGHNLETVPRLYPLVRPGARYHESLGLLERAARAGFPVRSGLLLGLGEDTVEVLDVVQTLARAGCRLLWLGQYLRPTPEHHPVARYARPSEFDLLAGRARGLGFESVAAGPLVRSSCT